MEILSKISPIGPSGQVSPPEPKKVYVETYGCQMNLADSEVVLSVLTSAGYRKTETLDDADVAFVNTCAIRENAEARIYGRLGDFKHLKKDNPGLVVGVLGCMAERLRKDLMETESHVDLVVGPDEYRRLPELVAGALEGERGIAVRLSRVENYDDILPLRTEGVSAWVSVMRGCDKFCTFCVVPFTRGRERSRSLAGVVREVEDLVAKGFREVTLLGQNVNSYCDEDRDFADLLAAVARVDQTLRIRFTTSHPQDMSDKLIDTIAEHENLCKYIHLPVQSGSDRILELMNRTYTVDHYRRLVGRIKDRIPGVSLSTDIIAGFPSETEDDHAATIDLLQEIGYEGAFTRARLVGGRSAGGARCREQKRPDDGNGRGKAPYSRHPAHRLPPWFAYPGTRATLPRASDRFGLRGLELREQRRELAQSLSAASRSELGQLPAGLPRASSRRPVVSGM